MSSIGIRSLLLQDDHWSVEASCWTSMCWELNDCDSILQTDISIYTCCGDCVLIPGVSDPCEMPGPSMWPWGLASGWCWHSWGGDTVTLTPALITLWRQTDRDRLISWGMSAKLGHAKWRSGGLFLFNFNLENPTKVLPLFDEQTTLQFGDLQTFLKGFL